MDDVCLLADELLDETAQIHFAFHQSLNEITFSHTHDFNEIFLITKGRLRHHVNQTEQVLQRGALVFIRADDRHYYERNSDEDCHLYNLAFRAETLDEMARYLGQAFTTSHLTRSDLPPMVMLSQNDLSSLARKFGELQSAMGAEKTQVRLRARILLLELFTGFFKDSSHPKGEATPGWLSRLATEMQKQVNFVTGLKRMKELAGCSDEHLARSVKKYYGVTPTDFLNDLRLNSAANLLLTSDYSIAYIAMEAGFNNISHFNHLFRKRFGQSPRQFRNQHVKRIIPG